MRCFKESAGLELARHDPPLNEHSFPMICDSARDCGVLVRGILNCCRPIGGWQDRGRSKRGKRNFLKRDGGCRNLPELGDEHCYVEEWMGPLERGCEVK
jgi:hypothetical protein